MTQTIFHGGPILTVDAADRVVEAVLVDGGRIAATGSLAEVSAQASPGAVRRDLAGRTMIPAFIDPHGHFPDSGFLRLFRADLSAPPIGDCDTLAEVFARLRAKAAETPPGEWVIGAMLEPNALAEGRFPTRDELDAVSVRHPVWVVHFTGHAGAGNSLALAARGIDETTPDPVGGQFGRDGAGRLDGLLRGMAAMGELGDTEFQIDYLRFAAAVADAEREYLSHGVTMAQNAWATEPLLRHFARLAAEAPPGIDLVVLPAGYLEPRLSAGALGISVPPGGPVRLGPRKLFGDGSFHIQTACITEPYHHPLNGEPGYRCEVHITVEGMAEKIGALHDAGHQVHVHCNGDATADVLLDAFERVLARTPRADHRHTLIHAQVLREDQLDRIAALGLSISFFPAHLHYWGDFHRDITFGPERVHRMCPTRSAAARGIRFTIHNDAQVTPTRPLHLMWCAVNRVSTTGFVAGPDQALTPAETLRAHTIDAAWQVFAEAERGSIEPGKRADLAILSANPLDRPATIREIAVEETIRGGHTAHRSTP